MYTANTLCSHWESSARWLWVRVDDEATCEAQLWIVGAVDRRPSELSRVSFSSFFPPSFFPVHQAAHPPGLTGSRALARACSAPLDVWPEQAMRVRCCYCTCYGADR